MLDSLIINSPKLRPPHSKWNACFPYYAGFPESFASDIIQSAELATNGVILDPWNGSGTTTLAASTLGYSSVGVDLNPVMVLVAKARALSPSEADSIEPQARAVAKNLDQAACDDLTSDPLCTWFSSNTTKVIRALEAKIRTALIGDGSSDNEVRFQRISCFASTFYIALFTICRRFTRQFQSSNPTWLRAPKAGEHKISLSAAEITSAFITQATAMAASLQQVPNKLTLGVSDISLGDTTSKPTKESFADLIITSPPYCTRIDYTAATRVELAILHSLYPHPIAQLSRAMIGTVKVSKELIPPHESWGSHCIDFLDQLSKHDSKASSGYYYKTHVDYFDKLAKSVVNIAAMLKPAANAVFVVQDSYYKDIHNDLAAVVVQMAASSGLRLQRRKDFQHSNPISGINTRARLYRRAVGSTESVLCFQSQKGNA